MRARDFGASQRCAGFSGDVDLFAIGENHTGNHGILDLLPILFGFLLFSFLSDAIAPVFVSFFTCFTDRATAH